MLNIAFMKDSSTSIECALPAHIKQSRPGYNPPLVILQAYPDDKSPCVFTCLKEYLADTTLRGTEKSLFITFTKPHRAISCLLLVLTLHHSNDSARSAATSRAKSACEPMDEILKTAGWSSTRSFDRFYEKPVSFASAVLHTDLTLVEFILPLGFRPLILECFA